MPHRLLRPRPGIGLALAGTSEMFVQAVVGWIGEARRSGQGVLLNLKSPAEGDLIGVRIPPNQLRRRPQPGRGYVVGPGGTLLQTALPLTVVREREAQPGLP